MKSAYIFHDAFCDPTSDWYPWMRTHLESQGYFVVVPRFPTPAGQSLASWNAVMKTYEGKFDSETIFIGHGTGAAFALRLAEKVPTKIAGLFLVAGYAEPIGHAGYDRVNESFFREPFAWDAITSHALAAEVFAGSDDPFVPLEKSQQLADQLKCQLQVIADGGHLNRASGFTQAVPIAQGIKERLGQLDKAIEVESSQDTPAFQAPPLTRYASEAWREEGAGSVETHETEAVPRSDVAIPKPAGPNPNITKRTMYEDMSTLVSSNTGTVASSLLGKAREDEEEKKNRSPVSTRNILYIIGTAVLVVGLIGIVLYMTQRYAPASKQAITPDIPSLIPADSHARIAVVPSQPSYQLTDAIDKELSQQPTEGTIKDIYYVTGASRTPLGTLVDALGITTIPPGMADQVPGPTLMEPTFMHGALLADGTQSEFVAMRITQYDQAFALMREWEPTLFRDLGPFFHVPQQFIRALTTRSVFEDEMIANRTIRVLRYQAPGAPDPADTEYAPPAEATLSPYEDGDVMLAYFFLNERTLVIVDSLETIPLVVTRWANSQVY